MLHGRLRSVVKKSDGKKEMLEELGRGEAVGVVRVCMCVCVYVCVCVCTSFTAKRVDECIVLRCLVVKFIAG